MKESEAAKGADAADNWLRTQLELMERWRNASEAQRTEAIRQVVETFWHDISTRAGVDARLVTEVLGQSVQGSLAAVTRLFTGASDTAQEGDASSPSLQQFLNAFPLGYTREWQAAWQELQRALDEYLGLVGQMNRTVNQVKEAALDLLSRRAHELSSAGTPIGDMRKLYDEWIECGEQAYGRVARDDEFVKLQAAVGDALVKVRTHQQALLEHWLRQFDLPTRSELNTVHQRQKEMRARLDALEARLADKTAEGGHPGRARRRT